MQASSFSENSDYVELTKDSCTKLKQELQDFFLVENSNSDLLSLRAKVHILEYELNVLNHMSITDFDDRKKFYEHQLEEQRNEYAHLVELRVSIEKAFRLYPALSLTIDRYCSALDEELTSIQYNIESLKDKVQEYSLILYERIAQVQNELDKAKEKLKTKLDSLSEFEKSVLGLIDSIVDNKIVPFVKF